MKIRISGAGWYGCHLATALLVRGHEVEVHDIAPHIFAGASGSNPARLHMGQHYPRSHLTRRHCQEHNAAFLEKYGHLTRGVPVNIYAIADKDSLVDFGNYVQVLRDEIEFVTVYDPAEYGLQNVEGAILTGERHIVISEARAHFEEKLAGVLHINSNPERGPEEIRIENPENSKQFVTVQRNKFDWEIDCTFCAREGAGVDRYEPCITTLLEGPTDRAVTIMDGPFGSIYPWDEAKGLNSLTSAKYTPLTKCDTWQQAADIIDTIDEPYLKQRSNEMLDQMAYYWPDVRKLYTVTGHRLGIRAMPRSGADARLVDIVNTGERTLRVRAGKIDAVLHAERLICERIGA